MNLILISDVYFELDFELMYYLIYLAKVFIVYWAIKLITSLSFSNSDA